MAKLFKKPTFAKSPPTDDHIDFSRSKTTYADFLQEQDKTRQQKLQRREEKHKANLNQDNSAHRAERRRTSSEAGSDNDNTNDNITTIGDELSQDNPAGPESTASGTSPDPSPAQHEDMVTSQRSVSKVESPTPPKPLNDTLSESESDVKITNLRTTFSKSQTPAPAPTQDEQDFESDEEFPELARKARERARSRTTEASQRANPAESARVGQPNPGTTSSARPHNTTDRPDQHSRNQASGNQSTHHAASARRENSLGHDHESGGG